MQPRDIDLHVNILGWLFVVSHALFLIVGGFVFFLLTTIGAVSGDTDAMAVLSIVGTFVGGILTVLALPGILAGYGLLKRRNWGRILAIVVGILNLANIPFGTALGIYTVWILLQEQAASVFVPTPSDSVLAH